MSLDTTLKVIQGLFFVTASTVAILTYIKAKNGLLNTVNTEYHKKVIERLSAVSSDLYAEFDEESENHWSRTDVAGDVVSGINEWLLPLRDKLSTTKKDSFGIPHPNALRKMFAYANRIRSDPFIPREIREVVLEYLDARSKSLLEAIFAEGKSYGNSLLDGNHWDTLDTNKHWVHNRMMDRIRADGFGIEECQTKVNAIRTSIQRYFEAFNPMRSVTPPLWSRSAPGGF